MFMKKQNFCILLLNFIISEIYFCQCDEQTEQISNGINGKKNKRFDKIILQTNGFLFNNYPEPSWKASAKIISDQLNENGPKGEISIHQWDPYNYLRIAINVTNLPVGKHAVHIHEFGDLSQGCNSTGSHMPNNFIGNIEAKENGTVSITMHTSYLSLFGYDGVIGRSIVIHEKPIEIDPTPIFSSPITQLNYKIEEIDVGSAIACGIITITRNT